MSNLRKTLACLGAGFLALSMSAETYIYLTKDNVNLRESPSTTAPVLGKGRQGTVFEVRESQGGWYKCSSPEYGETPVWVSASVSEEPAGETENIAMGIVNLPDAEIPYTTTIRKSGGEETETWTFSSSNPDFWIEAKPESAFNAVKSVSLISMNGSVRTFETYYKGSAYPFYLVLTEESTDGGDTYTRMESPVYVYPSLSGESGIVIDGQLLNDDVSGDEEW